MFSVWVLVIRWTVIGSLESNPCTATAVVKVLATSGPSVSLPQQGCDLEIDRPRQDLHHLVADSVAHLK